MKLIFLKIRETKFEWKSAKNIWAIFLYGPTEPYLKENQWKNKIRKRIFKRKSTKEYVKKKSVKEY